MRRLILQEHRTTAGMELAPAEIDVLVDPKLGIRVQPTPGRPGCYDVTPGSRVGAIQHGHLTVEIRPKLPIANVLFMATYSEDPTLWREDPIPFGEEMTLVDAIVPAFLRELERAIGPGVLYGYRRQDEAIMSVRGRVRFEEQVRRHFGRLPPVEVSFDEFTEDIELNRVLKAALHRLLWLRLACERSRTQLRRWAAVLDRVLLVDYGLELPEFHFTRLDERYRPAVALARLILREAAFELRQGAVVGTALLFDMNRVFEDFVAVALREALAVGPGAFLRSARGRALHLERDRRIRLEPDLSWWEGAKCVFVGDVKYKALGDEGARQADLYQLLAYTIAADVPCGMLIYAEGPGHVVAHEILRPPKLLEVAALDLATAPSRLLPQVDRLADRIREWRMSMSLLPV